MAAPVITPRSKPSGNAMPDGYRTLITIAGQANFALWERSVKPNAVDGGEPIDTSTMHNDKWHTFHPRTLLKMDSLTAVCGYVGNDIQTLNDLINQPNTFTVQVPDDQAYAFFGWLQKIDYSDHKEGEYPEVTVTIFPSMTDSSGNEEGPVYGSASGS